MQDSIFNPTTIVLTTLCVFATALAPMVGNDQRNYLVIAIVCLSVPILFMSRERLGVDFGWVMVTLLNAALVTWSVGGIDDISTIGFTGLFSLTYIVFCSALVTGRVALKHVLALLRALIFAFGVVSVLQMLTSLLGLPVPNEILTKGLWSYNSLAVEPSHAGRSLAVTMLAYLTLSRTHGTEIGVMKFLYRERFIIIVFAVSVILTGSSLAVMAAPLAIMLALPSIWIMWLSWILISAWPILYIIDSPVVDRALAFLAALPSMDISTIAEAEQSGALRIIPFLAYKEKIDIDQLSAWVGQGLGQIPYYIQGEMIGAGDSSSAGFIPGYLIAFGIIGSILFIYAFLGRFLDRRTTPFVFLWIVLFSSAAWNTQLFWYGLMLLRVVHHYRVSESAQEASVVPKV